MDRLGRRAGAAEHPAHARVDLLEQAAVDRPVPAPLGDAAAGRGLARDEAVVGAGERVEGADAHASMGVADHREAEASTDLGSRLTGSVGDFPRRRVAGIAPDRGAWQVVCRRSGSDRSDGGGGSLVGHV